MHPISKLNFGPEVGKIAIRYHNGTEVVSGYIVKQLGSVTYRVTTDGVTTYDVRLAQTSAEAAALVAGMATIDGTFNSAAVVVAKLTTFQCRLASSTALVPWTLVPGDASRVLITTITENSGDDGSGDDGTGDDGTGDDGTGDDETGGETGGDGTGDEGTGGETGGEEPGGEETPEG